MQWYRKMLAHWAMTPLPESVFQKLARRVRTNPATSGRLEVIDRTLSTLLDFLADPGNSHGLEIGAGKDLALAFMARSRGIKGITSIDLFPQVTVSHVERLRESLERQNLIDSKLLEDLSAGLLEKLEKRGIRYLAPTDASDNKLEGGALDFAISLNTLEHIPADSLPDIFLETNRTLKTGALFVNMVDYSDHYSNSDPTITEYNMLKFPAPLWKLFNPPRNYQNRLRHHQYEIMLEQAGFEVISTKKYRPESWRTDLLDLALSHPFSKFSLDENSWTAGLIVAQKKS